MSHISSLNLLGDDPSIPLTEEDVTNELALWANAQFKFDSAPGSALMDDSLKDGNEYLKALHYHGSEQHNESTTTSPTTHHHASDSLLSLLDHAHAPSSSALAEMYVSDLLNMVVSPSSSTPTSPTTPKEPTSTPTRVSAPTGGKKRAKKAIPASPSLSVASTMSAYGRAPALARDPSMTPEEDKRRRNTAASARFRMKKKQREHALQQTVQEMTQRTEQLEERCKELELEAKWLRALLVEKNPALITPLSKLTANNVSPSCQ
ncbi:hypothetical protein BC940DRAFT_272410 [Gongronella butleri]|nr:hypothetical protein BC940DRAFT_272410 [Gongronella butleri]